MSCKVLKTVLLMILLINQYAFAFTSCFKCDEAEKYGNGREIGNRNELNSGKKSDKMTAEDIKKNKEICEFLNQEFWNSPNKKGGAFGTVLIVNDVLIKGAVKVISYKHTRARPEPVSKEIIVRELKYLESLSKYPNHFAEYKGCYDSPEHEAVYIHTEELYADFTDDKLTSQTNIVKDIDNIYKAVLFTYKALVGLSVLHEKKISHDDIKPENIMADNFEMSKVKFIDFGGVTDLTKKGADLERIGSHQFTWIFIGPENFNEEGENTFLDFIPSTENDVFELGRTICEVIFGKNNLEEGIEFPEYSYNFAAMKKTNSQLREKSLEYLQKYFKDERLGKFKEIFSVLESMIEERPGKRTSAKNAMIEIGRLINDRPAIDPQGLVKQIQPFKEIHDKLVSNKNLDSNRVI